MFKHNYIQKLAYDNIRKQKKLYRFIFVSLVLVFVLSAMLSILFASYEEIGYRERYQRYGRWSLAMPNPIEDNLNKIKDGAKIGYLYELGDVSYQGRYVGTMSSLDNNAQDLSSLTLTDGRMPRHDNEIILEEEQCLRLGIPSKVNQTIELSVLDETKQYKIVGIVKNYSLAYPITLGNFLTTQITSPQKTALVYHENTFDLWNKVIECQLYDCVQYNMYTYNYYQEMPNAPFQQPGYIMTLKMMIYFIGFAGVLGTTISSIAKRTEMFALMRAIGATSKQIQKMVVYEGMMLIGISFVAGVTVALLVCCIILYCYANVMGSSFVFVINESFGVQMIFCFITAILGIYIPSIEAYFVPLRNRIQPSVRKFKKRKIRKVTVPKLVIRELSDHKCVSLLLIGIVCIGIIGGDLLRLSVSTYRNSMQRNAYEEYEHYISADNECLPQEQIDRFKEIKNVELQVAHGQDVAMRWKGIEKTPELFEYRDIHRGQIGHTQTNHSDLFTDARLYYYEDERTIQEMLNRHHFEGRYPQNENEVVIVKPYMRLHEHGGMAVSLTKFYYDGIEELETCFEDEGLNLGDTISFYQGGEASEGYKLPIDDSFRIVGIVRFDEASETERQLFDYSGYTLITNQRTYQKYTGEDMTQICLMRSNYKNMSTDLKKIIYEIQSEYPDLIYRDVEVEKQLMTIEATEDVLKDVSFYGILLVGILVLTYLQRKIKVLTKRHEIGLYRAIGTTKKQIYAVHLGYALIVYMGSVFFLGTWSFLNYWKEYHEKISVKIVLEIFEKIANPITLITVGVLGIGFVLVMFLPIRSVLKENLLKTITTE